MDSREQKHDSATDASKAPLLSANNNVDSTTVAGFGYEWERFHFHDQSADDLRPIFNSYFSIFPWERLPKTGGEGADIGCGSGRWSKFVAPHAERLHLVDASPEALEVARANLQDATNVTFHLASVSALPFNDNSLDFAFSLGVLHHAPDTTAAIRSIAQKLKHGAVFLVYLYYAMETRPAWYRVVWRVTDVARQIVSRLPARLRGPVCDIIAGTVYWPLSRCAHAMMRLGLSVKHFPLSFYADKSFYFLRNDALDRFGTRIEQRFTRSQIQSMLESSGFGEIRFSEAPPFWCAAAVRVF